MEHEFWHKKWRANQIGFHQSEANALLVAHFKTLNLVPGSRVFVPLCGKSLDMIWLLDMGFHVIGSELNELAVQQFFKDNDINSAITQAGALEHYHAANLDIYTGDIFELDRLRLGQIDAIYDRAALVALPEEMRRQYAKHLIGLTNTAPQFLLTFNYNQSQMTGPPFAITADEVQGHYRSAYKISELQTIDVPGGLKGVCPATETAWLLK